MTLNYRNPPFAPPLSEADIQRAVFAHLHAHKQPGVFAFHVPNGGFRRPKEAAIFKGMGVRAGVPDLIAIKGAQTFALELKADNGRPSPKQIETMQEMQACGAVVALATGLDQAIAKLEEWGLVLGEAS